MTLSERHLQELVVGSGIPIEDVARDGIRTITTGAEAEALGHWQQLAPAIAFTVRPPDGSNSLYVLKPDRPRARRDKPGSIKYEWPHGRAHRLDVVGDIADLCDPAVDLYIVEGKKKALALLAQMRKRGQRCVIIVVWGTWAWCRKKEDYGDKRPELLPDWDLIALDGRRIFVVFDSDRDEKENVDLAARQLAARLAERGAEVYHVILPGEPDGQKNGADDLIVRHGFETFERCRDEAIDRGPHGAEALRAAWRRQRAINRELKERLVATAALIEVPTAQLDPGEKAVLFAAAAELDKRQADQGSTDYRPFNLETMSKRAGLSPGTFGRKLDRFCQGEQRLFDKQRTRACPACKRPLRCSRMVDPICDACGAPVDVDDPRRSIFLRPVREGCGTFGGILWTAIRTADIKDDAWGGKRNPGIRTVSVPVCSENPDHPLRVHASCQVDGLVTLDATVNAPKDRNTQDACSPPEQPIDIEDVPVDVAIHTQDAVSAPGEPSLLMAIAEVPPPRPAPTGRCPGCFEPWTPRPGSDATQCGVCAFYAAQKSSALAAAS